MATTEHEMNSIDEAQPNPYLEKPSWAAVIGTLVLGLGGGLLFLMFAVVDRSGMKDDQAAPISLPAVLYSNRPLWYGCAVVLIGVGAALQKVGSAKPEELPPLFSEVVVYTRQDCHLCDEAKALLVRYSHELPMIIEVDIDPYPDLVEKHGQCVPVVEMDGKVRFKGRINPMLLERLLNGARQQKARQVSQAKSSTGRTGSSV